MDAHNLPAAPSSGNVPPDIAPGLDLWAAGWLDLWAAAGGYVTLHGGKAVTGWDESRESGTADLLGAFNDGSATGRRRAMLDMLAVVPHGHDAVRAHMICHGLREYRASRAPGAPPRSIDCAETAEFWATVAAHAEVEAIAADDTAEADCDLAGALVLDLLLMPAPDRAALRWKLDLVLEDGAGSYVEDVLAAVRDDVARLLAV